MRHLVSESGFGRAADNMLRPFSVRGFGRTLSLCQRAYSIQPPKWLGGRHLKGRSHFKGKPPGVAKSFAEKQAEHAAANTEKRPSVNIGVPFDIIQESAEERDSATRKNKRDRKMEKAARLCELKVPLDEVKQDWQQRLGPLHVKILADHYGIYQDLFAGAFFYPVVNMDVAYDVGDDFVMPVYRGNKISPSEALKAPDVSYTTEADSLWTLILTNPDGHLTDNTAEYIHWFIGNIPGSEVAKGDLVCNYLQPFPPCGTGLHRHVFILFQQNKRIDYSTLKRPENCTSLTQRTFSTFQFYKEHQDQLTPKGLCFFQSEYDESVQDTYHNVLDMQEPSFEYKHPVCYHPSQKTYPHKEPFDRYYDRYREARDIAEEVLKLKLESESPLEEPELKPLYPLIHKHRRNVPSWLKQKQELMARKMEQYKDL